MLDTEVLLAKWLGPEEKVLFKEIADHGTMNLTESLYWLLLKEISQHRAAADSLHRRLVALRSAERKIKNLEVISEKEEVKS